MAPRPTDSLEDSFALSSSPACGHRLRILGAAEGVGRGCGEGQRRDRRVGVRSLPRRQTFNRRGDDENLLRLPPTDPSSRLCLHALRTIKQKCALTICCCQPTSVAASRTRSGRVKLVRRFSRTAANGDGPRSSMTPRPIRSRPPPWLTSRHRATVPVRAGGPHGREDKRLCFTDYQRR
jgi:hypothetical protein